MKKCISLMMAISFVFILSGITIAADEATKEECMTKCKEAAQLVKDEGLEAALKKIQDKNGPFVWKNTYVFCLDLNKACNLAHPITPALIGKNLMAAKDANGKLYFAEFISVAKNKGEGWVSYMWPKPGEKEPSPKITYVYKVPDQDVAMLAGIYE